MNTTTYTLFRRGKRATGNSGTIVWGGITFSNGMEGEEWRNAQNSPQTEDSTLEFVAHLKSPADVAAIVRRDPLQKYVVFRGEMMEVSVAIPVFVNGKNLETFSREWDVNVGDGAMDAAGGPST